MLKGFQPCQQFRVVAVTEGATARYIIKYISKGMDTPRSTDKAKSQQEGIEMRKSMLCYMIGYMTHGRQARISKNLRKIRPAPVVENLDIDRQALRERVYMELKNPEEGDISISLLNKLTTHCQAHLWVIFDKGSKSLFEGAEGYYDKISDSDLREFKLRGYSMGCPGCIITQFLERKAGREGFLEPKKTKLSEEDYLRQEEIRKMAVFAQRNKEDEGV
jgi:hypothetical protein